MVQFKEDLKKEEAALKLINFRGLKAKIFLAFAQIKMPGILVEDAWEKDFMKED